ncbi:pyrroline-5-carboxylate reductase [Roseibacterium sp. SDUM158016]|uniref:pyrroline-5-carboxylate reductase n=1 Tax=Roseicyclus sediminis TaxID=2980997 RepID=UPI0021CE2347|nr:pyrroline-5-carboxylate reductase [Roseibacterium sp. SDUM158016]MCU4653633.1 pyrroline-5-carboxylate reductase [Roseibacterium sp. SDUM158016]
MAFSEIARRGLVMLGCGKMGSAMLEGWLDRDLPPTSVCVIDPHPSDWLKGQGVSLNTALPQSPAVVLLAVKPQMMAEALPTVARFGGGATLFLSVAAGTPIATYETTLGAGTRIVRAMPNTPAAIGQGITAIVGNDAAGPEDLALAEALLSAVGQVVRLDTEDQIDAVTGVSGSGPAYVFYLIDALAAAAEAEGLPPALAMKLAKATVAGAGALAEAAAETPEQLRINVTSPNGTTQAALEVLMDAEDGLAPLIRRTVAAGVARSRELRG